MINPIINGYTVEQLEAAFDAVCNPNDWKAEIFAAIPGEYVNVVVEAIKFYTATTPKVTLDVSTMTYFVESEGYRKGPAGDH